MLLKFVSPVYTYRQVYIVFTCVALTGRGLFYLCLDFICDKDL